MAFNKPMLALKELLENADTSLDVVKTITKFMKSKEIESISYETSAISLKPTNTLSEVSQFSWEAHWKSLKNCAPLLTTFLSEMIPTKKRENAIAITCLIASMICKTHNRKLSAIQEIMALLLYAGHGTTKVYQCIYID